MSVKGQCYAQRASLGKDATLKLAQFIRERLQKSQVWSSSAVAEGQQGKFYIALSLYSATNTLPLLLTSTSSQTQEFMFMKAIVKG